MEAIDKIDLINRDAIDAYLFFERDTHEAFERLILAFGLTGKNSASRKIRMRQAITDIERQADKLKDEMFSLRRLAGWMDE